MKSEIFTAETRRVLNSKSQKKKSKFQMGAIGCEAGVKADEKSGAAPAYNNGIFFEPRNTRTTLKGAV
jgi:hypothetical protein